MRLQCSLMLLTLMPLMAWAQDGTEYQLKFQPPEGRVAHYQLIVHGDAFVNKLPTSDKEFNGRMHLLEEILPPGDAPGVVQRLTFVDAEFKFGQWDFGFDQEGEHLTVRRGSDIIATELIDRPPAASVESGDIIGVVSSLAWSIGFPESGRVEIGETWTRRLDPAPPDVGQPIGPETIQPRKMYITNTLTDVIEKDGREMALIDAEMTILSTEGTRYEVTIKGPAQYWLDTGELHRFHGNLDIYVGIDISRNLVEIVIKHGILHFEERDPADIHLRLPPSGPWEMKFDTEPEDLSLWSYPIEPAWLEREAGIGTPPPEGKGYALNRKRLYERALREMDKPRTEEDEDAALWDVVEYVEDRLFYAYRIDAEMPAVREWARSLAGATVEPLENTPGGGRIVVSGRPDVRAAYFWSDKADRPLVVVTDDPELWELALQAADPAPDAPEPDQDAEAEMDPEDEGSQARDLTTRSE